MHPLDIAIVAAYLVVVLLLGRRASAGARNEEAFFLAERKFGRLRQFFFNFGNTIEALPPSAQRSVLSTLGWRVRGVASSCR